MVGVEMFSTIFINPVIYNSCRSSTTQDYSRGFFITLLIRLAVFHRNLILRKLLISDIPESDSLTVENISCLWGLQLRTTLFLLSGQPKRTERGVGKSQIKQVIMKGVSGSN